MITELTIFVSCFSRIIVHYYLTFHFSVFQETTNAFGSVSNDLEARAATKIAEFFVIANGIQPNRLGIIALYKSQASVIERLLNTDKTLSSVQVSTVDAFQGAEKDVIILTVCRTDQLGFSVSPKRLNVAITRAKRHLIVLGHPGLLKTNPLWREIIQPAYEMKNSGGIQNCSKIDSSSTLDIPEMRIDEGDWM